MSKWSPGVTLKPPRYVNVSSYYPGRTLYRQSQLADELYVQSAIGRSRRIKPAQLLVQHGTENTYEIRGYQTLYVGTYSDPDGYRRELTLNGLINQAGEGLAADALVSGSVIRSHVLNRIREEIISGKGQLAVDLAELGKTKVMFADAGRDLYAALRSIRGGTSMRDFVSRMKRDGFRGHLGNRWLEYIYGWAPTISGAFETAEIINNEFQKSKTYLGKTRTIRQRSTQLLSDYQYDRDRSCTCTGVGYYQYTVSDPTLQKFSDLGFTNPLAIAWELMPWSFVIDWFVDIGGYINRIDAALGTTNRWGQVSIRKNAQSTVHIKKRNGLHPYVGPNGTIGRITSLYSNRMPPTSSFPNTFMGLKKFTNEAVRLTSAVALLNQFLTQTKNVRN